MCDNLARSIEHRARSGSAQRVRPPGCSATGEEPRSKVVWRAAAVRRQNLYLRRHEDIPRAGATSEASTSQRIDAIHNFHLSLSTM
jgi:hypothetical protein